MTKKVLILVSCFLFATSFAMFANDISTEIQEEQKIAFFRQTHLTTIRTGASHPLPTESGSLKIRFSRKIRKLPNT